ncbi:MAG: diaminopimelate epimerase [Pseudomonadota bacterium]
MRLKFSKMHGLGNDFMVVDLVTQHLDGKVRERFFAPATIRRLADRHFGIGFDQLLVVEPPQTPDADFRYRIFNADGGEVEQCGNGARCFARFVRGRGLTRKRHLDVEVMKGVIGLDVTKDEQVVVDMGPARLAPSDVPADLQHAVSTRATGGSAGGHAGTVATVDTVLGPRELTLVSMGNPHGVMRVDDVANAPVAALGPQLEPHPLFPARANIGFMQVIDRRHIALRVFERGSGETLACGTGACAAVVAGQLNGWLDTEVTVTLPGGRLLVRHDAAAADARVQMTGPAATVYHGQIDI